MGRGNERLSRHLGHMTKLDATPIYGKTLQTPSSQELVSTNLGM